MQPVDLLTCFTVLQEITPGLAFVAVEGCGHIVMT